MDFLLSLSAKAKEKLSTVTTQNKSVMYSEQILSEEDTEWALHMKKAIADYLKLGGEGPFFHRMVETVLSRDKNWVRWKVENCPSIEKPPVAPKEFNDSKAVARRMATSRRLNPNVGSLSLDFLAVEDDGDALAKFRSKERCQPPDLMSLKRKIADDDFEIEMPTDNHAKAIAVAGKASKSWRALRIASRYKLASFDKIENPEKIDAIFEEDAPQEAEETERKSESVAPPPQDRRPIVLVGPNGVGKSALAKILLEKCSGAFAKVPSHTTRQPKAGEKNGVDYHFVDKTAFSMIRDGDQFLQFTDTEDVNYGTSRKLVEAVGESGAVAVMVVDHEVSLNSNMAIFTSW
jgi:THO complex subunit 1